MFNRIFLIVMDSVGIGASQDAALFGDEGTHTLKHTAESKGTIYLPNLASLGLGNIADIPGVERSESPIGSFGILEEISNGKDTMTGHWEMMGLYIKSPFNTFTETGFPKSLIQAIEIKTGRKVIGNKAASGIEIIEEFGPEHVKSGALIVYTSADSVLQIAAHEEVVPLKELYKACEITRELTLDEPYQLGRVIARPFLGNEKNGFVRTANRHDYALKPFSKTTLDALKENQYDVIGFGKIADIFDNEGITHSIRQVSNEEGMKNLMRYVDVEFKGLAFLNLVDFDALYGHRRDPLGYHHALEAFDRQLGELLPKLKHGDALIITADHGNDPTHTGTDHTREDVPLLVYGKEILSANLGRMKSFATIGSTIAENFNVVPSPHGQSFLDKLKNKTPSM
jgi:phosphopentomutase